MASGEWERFGKEEKPRIRKHLESSIENPAETEWHNVYGDHVFVWLCGLARFVGLPQVCEGWELVHCCVSTASSSFFSCPLSNKARGSGAKVMGVKEGENWKIKRVWSDRNVDSRDLSCGSVLHSDLCKAGSVMAQPKSCGGLECGEEPGSLSASLHFDSPPWTL